MTAWLAGCDDSWRSSREQGKKRTRSGGRLASLSVSMSDIMWCDGCNEKVGAKEKALNIMFVACDVGAFGSGNLWIIIAIGDDLGGDCCDV